MPGSTLVHSLFLMVAGVVAGTIGTSGGITSLVSYPALLIAGAAPIPADMANLVAFVVCWPGTTLTSRTELRQVRGSLPIGLLVTAVGTALGGVLLLSTPARAFAHIVPALVLLGGAVLLAQPRLTALAQRRPGLATAAAWPLIGLVGIYSGYAGAGSGVMLLCVTLVFVHPGFAEANALKNTLVGAGATVSTAIFCVTGLVPWTLVLPLGAGLFVGGMLGPVVARHISTTVVRWAVVAFSIGLAAELWLQA